MYRLTDVLAFVQTLDFFPPMVEDPYIFGQIAAANALSDIYAMGGTVKTALNIVCFPESMDLNILGAIMRGGAEKVIEAGGILAGGHSIADSDVKYGLSVTGVVNPRRMYKNNTGRAGDKLVLTKKLGVGLICCASRVGAASADALQAAVASMTTLNKTAAEIFSRYTVDACTDVTGFGLLVHLLEMLDDRLSCVLQQKDIPVFAPALAYADEFLLTAAAQRNRNFAGSRVHFSRDVAFAMEEVLSDPQTSGRLLAAARAEEAGQLVAELQQRGLPAAVIGEMTEKKEFSIYVG